MDGLTFTAQMVGHVLWPLVALLVVLLFRKPLKDRFEKLTHLKFGPSGVEARFGDVLEKTQEAMPAQQSPTPTDEIAADRARLERMVEISPRASVLEAFTLVDGALKERLRKVGVPDADLQMRSTNAILKANEVGLLGEAELTVWKNLRDLSNTARHQPELNISTAQAQKYVRLSTDLRSAIEHAVPDRDLAS